MHMEQSPRACPFMQIIDILGHYQQIARPFGIEPSQGFMRGVGPYIFQRSTTRIIETVNHHGITCQCLWRTYVLDAMAFPQPIRSTESREPAFRGNPGAGQDDDIAAHAPSDSRTACVGEYRSTAFMEKPRTVAEAAISFYGNSMSEPSADLTSRTYISQRLRLHYVDWGNPDAPPMILLHGGRDHCRNWDWIARDLRSDYHVMAPDLRGHGDSQWSPDGNYSPMAHVYDLAQLIHQQKLAPVTIIAHSFGGFITLRYSGLYPENIAKLVIIEGLGLPPAMERERAGKPIDQRVREWIDEQRDLSGRRPKRYTSIEQALARMQEENKHLTPERARHLTLHGIMQNEDGSYSWKFDNYVRPIAPFDITTEQLHYLWGRITCPTLLVYGKESWASNPIDDGRIAHFNAAQVISFENAGHWVHHDQQRPFLSAVREFLA
jgi:pimeloyl-ACP methyl ester carboxylesterase